MTDERDAENEVVALLDYDKMELAGRLLRDRLLVHFAVRLRRAGQGEGREAVMKEMSATTRGT